MHTCPMTNTPCTAQPACDFTERLVHVGNLVSPAGLGKTPCAKWVEKARAEGRAAREAAVDPAAADALEA